MQTPLSRAHLAPHVRTGPAPRGLFNEEEWADARRFFAGRHELTSTPLRTAPALAASLGVGHLWIKDETNRYGLPAFKSLGAQFAVAQLAREGRLPDGGTIVCASEGNHGRAVARAARMAGLAARVYVGARVAPARVDAMVAEGATVIRTAGTYDDAVRRAAEDAAHHGWIVVSDTGWAGYDEIPRLIMLGYTQMMEEAAREWDAAAPDVVLVQGGVGGLACAVGSWWAAREGHARPRLVCVEPLHAACLQVSARHGAPVGLEGPLDTIMGGLRCGEVSLTAFPTIAATYDAYVAMDDAWAREAMRRLARPDTDDPRIEAGPSGAAGLGALLALTNDPALADVRTALALSPTSRVLVIVTEGVTEPELFASILAGD